MKNPLRLIDKKGLILLLGVVSVLTLVSVIAIVLTVSSRNQRMLDSEVSRLEREEQTLTNSLSYGFEDFFLDSRASDEAYTFPHRERQDSWSAEDVARYWIDPSEAGLETLIERNDRDIYEVLGLE